MKPNPLLIISVIFAASFSGRAITMASASGEEREKPAAPSLEASGHEAAPESAAAPTQLAAAEAKPHTETAAKSLEPAPAPHPTLDPGPLSAADTSSLLAAIRDRAARLDAREAALAERARLLEVVERRIEDKAAEMKTLKADLESRLTVAETAVQTDLTHLAKMYESMKPSKAGEIFNAMDSSFAAGFLTQMNSESAALILANMETQKAYAASVIIAGRNASVNQH